jgi:hypothetical protein
MEHQSPTVRSRVISMLTDNNAYCPEYVELRLTDTDCEVRTEAVRHLCQTGPAGPRETLKRCFISVNPKIVFAGLRCLTEYYPEEVDLVGEPLIERVLNAEVDSVGARAAAARALGMARLPSATRFLDRLLRDPNEEVVREAIRSSSQIVHEGAIPLLIAMLSVSALRRDAREALVKFGPLAMTELKARLYDDDVSTSVRARIPKVCSLMLRQEVADFLLESVHRLNPQLDAPLVKALNRMRTRSRDIVFDSERVSALIREECEKHGRLGAIRRSIRFNEHNDEKEGPSQADDLAALLEKAIVERQQENVETILRLLHLIYSPTDIRSVHFSVNARPENRASAVEFLDNLIEPALRELVVPVIEEDNQDPEHWRDAERGASLDEALSALITGNDEWLRAIAEELVERRTPANVLSVA